MFLPTTHCNIPAVNLPIPACSHIVEVMGNVEGGHLVQLGRDNAPPLPLTEEHSLPVLLSPLLAAATSFYR
jgi:hypothetical protein